MSHKHCKCKKKLNCDLTLNGKLKVKEDAEFKRDVKIDKSLIIPKVDTTTVSPVCKKADLVYDTSIPYVNDNQLHLSDGKEWLTVPANPVGGVYTINPAGTGDFPTIQAGINYCSSGLKPVANSNLVPPLPLGAKNVTLSLQPGLYVETPFFDTAFSNPTINDPATDLPNLRIRGLRLVGDTRPIANMTYMNGGYIETDLSFLADSGRNSLGTLNGVVTLTNVGNTITVTSSLSPQPAFDASGVVAGDIIIVGDTDGTFQQRNVVSVSGNAVTYDGSPVTISGLGATLTFCANVQVMSAVPDAICFVASGQVEMIGIWFSGNPLFATTSVYGLYIEATGFVYMQNLLVDGRNIHAAPGITIADGGQIGGGLADSDIFGHTSIIAGSLGVPEIAYINFGNYYVMASQTQPEPCVIADTTVSFNAGIGSGTGSLQVNGAGMTQNGFFCGPQSVGYMGIFTAFNCSVSCYTNGGNVFLPGTFTIGNCGIGIQAAGPTSKVNFGLQYQITESTISNCTTAILADVNGQVSSAQPFIINNCTNGIQLTNGSNFTSSNDVTFIGVTNKYAIDGTSTYLTNQNTSTDPSPNNIYSYTTAGAQTMNSAYLNQLLNASGVINVQLNPSLAPNGVPAYQGKTYTLTKVSGGNHTLTLSGATFLSGSTTQIFTGGPGSTLTFSVISATQVAILSNIGA